MSDDNVITVDAWAVKAMKREPRDELPAQNVAHCALEKADELRSLIAIGVFEDGSLFAASTMPHTADALLLLDRVRQKLMQQFDGDTFG